ncbi:MAG: DUF1573 domain-containing protein [Planctomycetaceae bacterium]|jgi:hypothetical protein|nr:DUF1573 domain-containing protein [Planctomycetaceae bacterium]
MMRLSQQSSRRYNQLVFSVISIATIFTLTDTLLFSQQWAEEMFEVRNYDFGNISRYAKAEYEFQIYNPYLEEVHIKSATTSCSCTSVYVKKSTLKTYETGSILAHFNTDRFTGMRDATITVVIDRPFYAIVQLHVKGVIRSDILFQPSEVNFGNVNVGESPEKDVIFSYNGHNNWKVTKIHSSNPAVLGELTETERKYGQVKYQLKVKIAPNAPAGYINDRIILVTNEGKKAEIPFVVQGHIRQGVTVNPTSLVFGNTESGKEATQKIVVRAEKPFTLKEISCDNKRYQFELLTPNNTTSSKNIYIVAVTFKAAESESAQNFHDTIKIITDAQATPLEINAYVKVSEPKKRENSLLDEPSSNVIPKQRLTPL